MGHISGSRPIHRGARGGQTVAMDKKKTLFDLPEDIEQRLMDEAEDEARQAHDGKPGTSAEVIHRFYQKVRAWLGPRGTLH